MVMRITTKRRLQISALVSVSALLTGFQAGAAEPHRAAVMKTGGLTSQPIGHYEFCQRSQADCRRVTINTRPRELTTALWQEIVSVNRQINALVRPVTDIEFFGVEEHWTLPESDEFGLAGDCEDYVLAKQRELLSRGWRAATLLPTVVRRKNGEGHAVLTVRTDRGDFILDNLSNDVLPWNVTDYSYLKRVSVAHSGRWEVIVDQRTVVGSVAD